MMKLDTVEIAKNSLEQIQPYKELGLKDDEYARIKEILGRRPTSSELAMYSVMWSEHCSFWWFGPTAATMPQTCSWLQINAGCSFLGSVL